MDIIKQYWVDDFVKSADFYLPKYNILIFVDGTYYHCFPEHKLYKYPCYYNEMKHMFSYDIWQRDKWVTEECIRQGFVVVRIWEHDVMNEEDNGVSFNKCINKIEKAIKVSFYSQAT